MVHLKRWTRFFETFPVGPNRSIEFWTEIFGNFGWMDRAHRNSQNGSKSTNHKPQAYNANVSWPLNVKSAVMYAVFREFLMILSDIFLTRWSKCTNQFDFLVWAYREQCVHFILSDIAWRGSKCPNHRRTILIACFLYFVSIFLSSFCGWSILVGRLNNPIVAAAIGKLKTGLPFKNLGEKFFST